MALRASIKDSIFHVGDTVEVYQKIKEKDKTRTQIFRGVVICIKGHGENKSFTVRRIAAGAIGVERIWPLNTPWISKIKVAKHGKVKRAKLYYLRKRGGREALRVKRGRKAAPVGMAADRADNKEVWSEKEKSGKAGGESSSKASSG